MEAFTEILFHVFTISILRYFIIAGIPFVVFYIFCSDTLKHLRIQKRQAKKKDFFREIGHSLQTTIVFTIIACGIMFTPLKNYTLMYDNVTEYPKWWLALGVVLALIIHDTYFYWMHRLMHHPKIYRYTHKLHHQSVTPSPWASYSFSIAEAVAEALVLIPIVLLMPTHRLTIMFFTVAGFIINVYGHLGYEIAPKVFRHSIFFRLFNTSVHHNLHHSRFNGNYGLYFRFWDRLMNTENPQYVQEYDRVQQQRFGQKNEATSLEGKTAPSLLPPS